MLTFRKHIPGWPAIVACLFLCASIFSQEQTPQKPLSPVVKFNLIVTDHSNHAVDDLQQDQVQVFEDNVPQKISQFAKDERPVDYALAMDASGSFRTILPMAVAGAKIIVNGSHPGDEAFLERFISADKIETVTEFTPDKDRLIRGLSSLYVEGGQSAVIDGLYLAVKHLAEHRPDPNRRRALIVFTDGEDRRSYYSEKQLFELLRESDVQVFAIAITFDLDDRIRYATTSRERAEKFLRGLAQATGGRVFFPKYVTALNDAANEVSHNLHAQYLVSYQSTNAGANNFRAIEVKITDSSRRDKLTAITRPGYFVTPPDSSEKEKDKKSKSKG